MTVYCARDFSADDIETIRRLMQENPALQRSPLSVQLCELWNWRKPNGELKDMTCRVPVRQSSTRRYRNIWARSSGVTGMVGLFLV